jgi:hypothetical protein
MDGISFCVVKWVLLRVQPIHQLRVNIVGLQPGDAVAFVKEESGQST